VDGPDHILRSGAGPVGCVRHAVQAPDVSQRRHTCRPCHRGRKGLLSRLFGPHRSRRRAESGLRRCGPSLSDRLHPGRT
jgi:hypothetical protein